MATLTLDAVSDTGISNSDGITNNAAPTLTGTAEAGSTVTIFADGEEIGAADADEDGAFTFTVPDALADGDFVFTAMVTDVDGNESEAPPRSAHGDDRYDGSGSSDAGSSRRVRHGRCR